MADDFNICDQAPVSGFNGDSHLILLGSDAAVASGAEPFTISFDSAAETVGSDITWGIGDPDVVTFATAGQYSVTLEVFGQIDPPGILFGQLTFSDFALPIGSQINTVDGDTTVLTVTASLHREAGDTVSASAAQTDTGAAAHTISSLLIVTRVG